MANKVILMTKLKNGISKIQATGLEFHLRNVTINGVKRGCSGHVKNTETGHVVYINTEKSCYQPLSDKNLYRVARDIKDYGGAHSRNRWATDCSLAQDVVNLLKIGGQ